ncbi:MAG: helix-turn-helix transcriptional regulator [Firmicutes bacterium]|nr:helix-turn-helix transcriptional regulator [Bacillota bacterium]
MNKELNKIVGSNLRKYRNERGITQEALAEQVNISSSFYANIERGNKSMSLEVLCGLAAALGVSIDSLFHGEENKAAVNDIAALLADSSPETISLCAAIIRSVLKELEKNAEV